MPKAKGGTDDIDNLQAICTACHDAKTAREHPTATGRPAFDEGGRPVWPD